MSTGSVDILAEIKNGSPQKTIQKRQSLSQFALCFLLTPNKDVMGGNVRQTIQTYGRKGEDNLEDLVVDGKIIKTLTTWKQCVRTWNRLNLLNRNDQKGLLYPQLQISQHVVTVCSSTVRHTTSRVQKDTMLFEIFALLGCYAARSGSS